MTEKKEKKYTCVKCKGEVEKNAKVCPHCGKKNPTVGLLAKIIFVWIILMIVGAVFSSDDEKTEKAEIKKAAQEIVEATTKHWYDDATLIHASALEWQEASYENKLATAGNIYAVFWNNKKLSNKVMKTITSVDSLKPWSENLVTQLDTAFKKDPDPEKNKMLFTNQKVGDTAVLLMTMQGELTSSK